MGNADGAQAERRVVCLVTLAACAVLAPGCRQLLGVDEYAIETTDDGGGDARLTATEHGGIGFARGSCAQCLDAQCAPELDACAADPTCASFAACDAACEPGDDACASLCAGRHTDMLRGVEPWELLSCRVSRCSEPCGRPCNGLCVGNLECDRCLSSQCAPEGEALAADRDSTEAWACVYGMDAIYTPAAVACAGPDRTDPGTIAEWMACRDGPCAASCSYFGRDAEPDLRCAGQVPVIPPADPFGSIEIEVFVADSGSPTAVPDAEVRACRIGSGTCDDPGVTEDDGVARIVARARAGRFYDYLEVTDTRTPSRFDRTFSVRTPPAMHDGARTVAAVVMADQIDAYYAANGDTWDRARHGTVNVVTQGCGGLPGPGFAFESSGDGRAYYFTPALVPGFELSETGPLGAGGFVDVPPGTSTVSASHGSETVATAVTKVAPGALSFMVLTPSPPGGW